MSSKLSAEELAAWNALGEIGNKQETHRKGFLSDDIYHTILENVPSYKYDEVDKELNEMFELVYNMKEENKKLKEENEKLKPLKKPSNSVDKPDWIEVEKINMANREQKLKEEKILKQFNDKIVDDDDDDDKPIIQDLDKHLTENKSSNNKLELYWHNQDFKHGDLVVNSSGLQDEIYKLISETKTQFRVSKLECIVAPQNRQYDKYYRAELRGYGKQSAGYDLKIKWNRNWKNGKTGNITKKKLEKQFFVIDKKYLTFEDSNNTVIL